MPTDPRDTPAARGVRADPGSNPVTVEVTRGDIVESQHRGAAAIVDISGAIRARWGDIERPIYPRSAIKALQAIACVETGAADAADFDDEALALACASHNAEPAHIRTVTRMLDAIGLDETALECGPQWPTHAAGRALAAEGGEPDGRHNNCSGKHAGMLALARQLDVPHAGYAERTHPVQQRIMGVVESLCGIDLSRAPVGTDGCSVPTWAIPLENLAYAFALFGTGEHMPDERAAACRRLREAVFAAPFMVAGTERFCTDFMVATAPRAFVKTGAEGVFCAAVPEFGLGIALKCDDGAARAAEVMLTAILRAIGALDDVPAAVVERFLRPPVENRHGTVVGEIRPASDWIES